MLSNSEPIAEKIRRLELDTGSAREWAQAGKIEAWVHQFLLSGTGGETNPIFSEGLKRERRWWRGPLEIELTKLSPAVGVEPDMEYVVAQADWSEWTNALAQTFTDALSLPPLILEYRAGELSVRDGNTRLGAMKLLGWSKCWVVIWYNSEADFDKHVV